MLIPIGFFGGGAAAGAYELISSQILTGTAASVTFSSIPTGYKHLQIRMVTKVSNAANGNLIALRLNGATTNYYSHHLEANGSTVASGSWGAESYMPIARIPANNDTTGAFSAIITDITDAFSTTNNKTIKSFGGYPGLVNYVSLRSGLYSSTSAITSLTLLPYDAANFISGSRFSLYGIKGA